MLDAIEITKRETEVLTLVCAGLEPKQIASKLGTSPWTVRSQIKTLMMKTSCNSRVKLVLWAIKVRLCDV